MNLKPTEIEVSLNLNSNIPLCEEVLFLYCPTPIYGTPASCCLWATNDSFKFWSFSFFFFRTNRHLHVGQHATHAARERYQTVVICSARGHGCFGHGFGIPFCQRVHNHFRNVVQKTRKGLLISRRLPPLLVQGSHWHAHIYWVRYYHCFPKQRKGKRPETTNK